MSLLRIEAVRLERIHLDPTGAKNAKRLWTEREGRLLRLFAAGEWGLGEASPLPGYSPDTLEEVEAALSALPTDLGLDLDHPLASAAEISAPLASVPAARFAAETALLDLAARKLQIPAARLLGPERSGLRAVAELLAGPEAVAVHRSGIAAVKIKIAGLAEDLDLIRAVRAAAPGLRVRLDANQLPLDAAFVRALEPLEIEFLEEPGTIPESGPPLALDESLRAPGGTARLEALAPRLGAVVLKPAVLGGLAASLAWAERAARLGVPSVVSHLFDGPVAASALRALALALPPGGPAHGLGLRRAGGPTIVPARGPGFGARPGVDGPGPTW